MSGANTETNGGLNLPNFRGLVAAKLSPQARKESPFYNPTMLQRSQQSEQTDTYIVSVRSGANKQLANMGPYKITTHPI